MRKVLYYGEEITGVEDATKTVVLDVLNVKKLAILSRVTFPVGADESFFIRVKVCNVTHTNSSYNLFTALYKEYEFKALEADSDRKKSFAEIIDVEPFRKLEITFVNNNGTAVMLDFDVEGSEQL